MTTGPGVYQHGGGAPPFEGTAGEVLGRMRGAFTSPPRGWPPPLSEEERDEAQQRERCLFCSGIHAGMSTPGCPRLASFKLDGDQKVTEGTFWPGTEWAHGRVVLAEDAAEESTEEEGGDGR